MVKTAKLHGTVKTLNVEKGFGFIIAGDGREYFFHRSAVDDFGELRLGATVRFLPGEAQKGPRAEEVERV